MSSDFTAMSSALLWLIHVHLLFLGTVQTTSDSARSSSSTHHNVKQLSACRIQLSAKADDVINLEPLARKDGFPRFVAVYEYKNHPWNYSFNPCEDYTVPHENPHSGFGDGCHSISVCKYTLRLNRHNYYTLGIHASAKFRVEVDGANNRTVKLVYKAIKSMRSRFTVIKLVCNETRRDVEDGLFVITSDTGRGPLTAELHHRCCCVGGCWKADPGTGGSDSLRGDDAAIEDDGGKGGSSDSSQGESPSSRKGKKGEEQMMMIMIGSLVAVCMLVALIGGLCYVKRTQQRIYSKLPVKSGTAGKAISLSAKLDLQDYEPAGIAEKKLLPVLEDTMIPLDSLEMCQRLGGGIFGDTHLGKWKGITVAVKRLTLLVHEDQVTPEAMKLMKNEVWFLSRQRHKNIVTILGLCLDGKLPSILTEHVVGECLRDFLKVQGRLLTWPHRVRICAQVADGMAFLHSTKPPIIHRDLRCGNIFLLDNDVIKVADFGLIKMLQPIREQCPQDDCCCRRTMSACPASVRWTAPELLAHPTTTERLAPPVPPVKARGDNNGLPAPGKDAADTALVITPACDVYSFAMVMWEVPMCHDPFDEVAAEAEVLKIVKNGGRPETPPSAAMMPLYKELMKFCWDQVPSHRPAFKQIATRLKDMAAQARAYQKQLHGRQRMQKLQEDIGDV